MANGKYTTSEFASIIRDKYNSYQDIDDSTLVEKWLEKYPVYSEKIDFGEETTQPETQEIVEPELQEATEVDAIKEQPKPIEPEVKTDKTSVSVSRFDEEISIDKDLFPKEKKKIKLEEENVSDENRVYEKDIIYIDKKAPITPEIRQTNRGNFYLKQDGKNYKVIRTDNEKLINFDPLQGRDVVDMPETTEEIVQSDLLRNENINIAIEQDTDYGKEPAWKQLGYDSANDYYKYIADEDEGSITAYKGLAPIGYMTDKALRVGRTVVNIGKGFKDFGDLIELNKQNLIGYLAGIPEGDAREAYLDVFRKQADITDKPIDKVIDTVSDGIWERDYTIVDAIEKAGKSGKIGDMIDAADMVVGGVLESAPYTILALTGLGGLISIGTSAAGNKFDELTDDEANKDEALSTITLNAIGTGALEASFELVTRGLWKKAKGLISGGNKEAAEELVKSYGRRLVERLAIPGAEGVSESATEFSTELLDFLTLDKFDNADFSKWFKSNWKKWADAGIIGVGTGTIISNTGRLTSDKESVRNAAETVLTPESDKKVINDAAININALNEQLKKAYDKESIRDIEAEILKEEAKIVNTKKKVSEELNLMNKDELKLYAKNKDKINTYKSRLKSKIDIPFVEKKTQEQIEELEVENENFIREAVDRRLNEVKGAVNVKEIGRTVGSYKDNSLFQKAYNNTEMGKKNPMDVTSADGFIDENGDIYINDQVAKKVRNVNVAAHELLHGILSNTIQDEKELNRLVEEFKTILPKETFNLIQKRIDDNYRFTTDEQGNRVERPKSEYMEEYFTAFADLIGNRQIKFNENLFTRIGNKIAPIFKGKGYNSIEFKTGKDVYDFIRDYQKQIAKGELAPETIEAAKKVAEQDIDTKFSKTDEQTINNFTKKEGKPMSQVEWLEFTGEMNNEGELVNQVKIANAFEGAINAKIKGTNQEVQNYFGRSRDNVIEDFKEILDKRGFFDSKIEQFNPEVNDNFSGYMAGIINNAYKDLLDKNTKRIKTVPTSKKIGSEDSKTTIAETLVSDEISPEDYTDMKLVQDKLKKIKPQQSKIANKINLTNNEINLAKRDIINFLRKTDRPSMTDPKKFFKAFVDYTTGSGVQPGGFAKVIYDKLSLPKDGRLSTKNRKAFIESIAEDLIALNKVDPAVMRRSKWTPFYELEIKNMNPTQMQKAIDEGRIPSTTNLKSGLDLFKTLDPSVDQVVDYLMKIRPDVFKRKMPKFLGEVIVKNEFNEILENPIQPIYDTKGNETDNTIDLSESITEEEVVRGAPKVREKIARPKGVKFSKNLKALEKQNQKNQQPVKIKIHDAIREVAGQLDHVNPKSVEKIKRFIVDILAPIMKGDVYNFIRSQDLSPIGNRGEKKIGLEFFLESIVPRSKDQDVIGFNQTLVEENILGTLSDLRNELSEAGIEEGDQVTILSEIFKKQELNDLSENLENLDERKKATKELLKKFRKSYKNDKSGLPVLKELFYNPNASRMWGKNVALLRSIFEGVTNKAKYEEHTYQFGNWSRRSLQAIKSNDKIFNGWLDWAAENYYQTAFDSKFKTPITRNVKIGPTTKSETKDLTYQEAVDKTYIKDGIVWEAKAQEHPLLRKQLDEAFKTGDFSKVPASEIRFFNEFFTLNPFKLTLDGQTFAEKYNLKVPKNLQDNIDIYQKAGELIYKKILTNAGILTGAEAMTDANAQSQLDVEIKLADNKQKSKIATEKELNNIVAKFSKTMSTEDVISYAKTLDNALANARKLDAPVKKIRVFDFDDTLAETKSLVFYNKPSDTKTVKPKLKAIVMAGPPGGGKSSIIKGLGLVNDGFKEVNQDISLEWLKTKEGLPAKESDYTKEQKSMRSKLGAQARKIAARKLDKFAKQGDGIILDGTGASVAATEAKIQALEELGYEVSMIYVNTPKETAIARNKARKERSLPDFIVEKTWDAVDANRNVYAGRFGDKFYEVNTEGLKQGEVPQEVSDAIRNDLAAEERGRLTAEEFAKQGKDLVDQGFVMDFSDFNIVREGERGPLFEVAKKINEARGNEDLFVLTARAPESADAIYEFLKSEGLEFKRENIIGLGNSTGAAKANWIVDKAAEGYNDFYFADDAYANVQAVQDALDQIDVKSQVQQAKVKFSKSINKDFNKIIEQTTGIASEKRYSKAKAKVRGAGKGNKKFFIPYSAEDFMGLIYPLLSKGTLGDSQMAWFKEHLLDPYGRAIENLSSDRIQMMQDFKELKKSLEVPKDLRKKTETGFTNEQAVRVYLFNKVGHDVPGLSETDLKDLIDIVNSDGKLKAFADQILSVTKGDGYVKPAQEWLAGTITTDLIDLLNTTKRKKYLERSGYLENANEIFSQENLNKLEAAYGAKYREAVENVLARMKSGKNRMFSGSRLSNRVLDYINGSIGTIMFFNTRSAVLQTISSINFLNWSFNNPYKAGKAFANQPQYWKDFKTLMNSDYLTDRRNGLKLNISENEIANAAATAKNKARGAMNYILQKGYLPTQFADSFAIASGGATFYRNRINDLVNQGMDVKQAEKQALSEWKETAEISQQSSDPSKISQQQASDLGRVILAFANTPMQYARIQKRAIQDLVNKRGDAKANVSKIIYYGVVQNLIFNALQQAVFALGFGDDEDDEKKQEKYIDIANGMLDSTLRGLGIAGATTAVIKNFLLDIYERSGRKRPEYVDAVYKLLALSPPISSKISKIRQAAYQFDSKKRRQEIFEKGFSIDNPAYEAGAKIISATTNLPLDRVLNKVNNIEAALSEDPEVWQRVAMLAGWPEWQIMPKEKKKEELPKFPGAKVKQPKKYIKTFKKTIVK